MKYAFKKRKSVKRTVSLPPSLADDLELFCFRAERYISQVVSIAVATFIDGEGQKMIQPSRRKIRPTTVLEEQINKTYEARNMKEKNMTQKEKDDLYVKEHGLGKIRIPDDPFGRKETPKITTEFASKEEEDQAVNARVAELRAQQGIPEPSREERVDPFAEPDDTD